MRLFPLLLLAACFAGPTGTDTADSGPTGHDSVDTGDTGGDTAADTGETGDTAVAPTLLSIEVSPDPVTLASTRDLPKVTAKAWYSDNSSLDPIPDCAWSTDDPAVALVTPDGTVHGLASGETTVTCTWNGKTDSATVTIQTVAAPQPGDLVINELLADPAVDADVNGDGHADSTEDEFVELVNVAGFAVNLEGVSLWDANLETARHTFGSGTLLPGSAVVVFGGGTPALTADRCVAYAAFNADSALKYGLALNNDGDTLTVRDAFGTDLTAATVDPAVEDASIVLNPELVGTSYTHHKYAPGSTGPWSPCTLVDGSAFPTATDWLAR